MCTSCLWAQDVVCKLLRYKSYMCVQHVNIVYMYTHLLDVA